MIKFGTGGWRAVIGDEFTKENIQILAKALVDKMRVEGVADKGIVLGYDRRFLSKRPCSGQDRYLQRKGLLPA